MAEHEIVPARTDVESVLRRAIEKAQRAEVEAAATAAEPVLDTAALTEIAAEVGVPAESLAAALAEAQAGVDERRGVLAGAVDRVVGPRTVWVSRPTDADEAEARRRIVDWLESNHGLRPRVRADGVVVAAKRRDVAGKMAGGIRRVRGLGGLGTASSIQAAAVDAGDGQGSVCLAADVGNKRAEAIAGGSVIAVGGTMVVGVTALITAPVVLVGVPIAAGVGTVASRLLYRSTVRRIGDTLEETVDGVARGDEPPHPLGRLRVRRTRRDRDDR